MRRKRVAEVWVLQLDEEGEPSANKIRKIEGKV
jgi:hypothetical protein